MHILLLSFWMWRHLPFLKFEGVGDCELFRYHDYSEIDCSLLTFYVVLRHVTIERQLCC
jgi:hypothetical protein